MNIIVSLLQLDYLKAQRFQPRKPWWKNQLPEIKSKDILKEIRLHPEMAGSAFTQFNVGEKELYKHTLLLPFYIDLDLLNNNNEVKECNGYLMTYFRKDGAPYFAFIREEQMAYS